MLLLIVVPDFKAEPLHIILVEFQVEVFDPLWIKIVLDDFSLPVCDILARFVALDLKSAKWVTKTEDIKVS